MAWSLLEALLSSLGGRVFNDVMSRNWRDDPVYKNMGHEILLPAPACKFVLAAFWTVSAGEYSERVGLSIDLNLLMAEERFQFSDPVQHN